METEQREDGERSTRECVRERWTKPPLGASDCFRRRGSRGSRPARDGVRARLQRPDCGLCNRNRQISPSDRCTAFPAASSRWAAVWRRGRVATRRGERREGTARGGGAWARDGTVTRPLASRKVRLVTEQAEVKEAAVGAADPGGDQAPPAGRRVVDRD